MASQQSNSDQLKELYAKHDKNEDHHLTRDELLPILTEYLGYDVTPYVDEVMRIADKDGSGTINSIHELDLALKQTGTVELKTIFKKYDKDGNNALSKEELIPLIEEMIGMDPSAIVDDMLDAGDENESGTIDTLDELKEVLEESKAIKLWTLQNRFNYYASEGIDDGFITDEDIVKITEYMDTDEKEELKALFKKADVNGDGKVSKEEYVQLMMKQ